MELKEVWAYSWRGE